MSKQRILFFCQECGAQSAKWIGKCPNCKSWNSYVEEKISKQTGKRQAHNAEQNSAEKLSDVSNKDFQRLVLGDDEFNRVLGSGVVPGSLILIGGEPGIGKSTLLLQMLNQVNEKRILYVSGEESASQIKQRADRLGVDNKESYLLTATSLEHILEQCSEIKPELLIIDSIQTLRTEDIESAAGSISQLRECAAKLQQFSNISGIAVFIVGHITKDGAIAGPKVLEHIVDVVLQFEGDNQRALRILRTIKNRFGSTAEIGIYEMVSDGLQAVNNPSMLWMNEGANQLPGTVVAAGMEGLRPLMIETQALVTEAVYGNPQRSCTGFDLRRLNMLVAVLEKRMGYKIGSKDIFLNITGGLKVADPAIDLAIMAALISSYNDKSLNPKTCYAGEVGLSGELRPVNRVNERILEAERMGFDKIVISDKNKLHLPDDLKINIHKVAKLNAL